MLFSALIICCSLQIFHMFVLSAHCFVHSAPCFSQVVDVEAVGMVGSFFFFVCIF